MPRLFGAIQNVSDKNNWVSRAPNEGQMKSILIDDWCWWLLLKTPARVKSITGDPQSEMRVQCGNPDRDRAPLTINQLTVDTMKCQQNNRVNSEPSSPFSKNIESDTSTDGYALINS